MTYEHTEECTAKSKSDDTGPCNCGASDNIRAWHEGLQAGIRLYAFWREGEKFVGICGRTLTVALAKSRYENPLPVTSNSNYPWKDKDK